MAPARKRRRSRRGGVPHQSKHTSHPTGRAAYAETRKWLLATHGPTCAYCGGTFPARTLTLDHVTPRRGQTAYDRRDNLVLACKRCNAAKADKPFLAYLLAHRTRARHLYLYGQHLSHGILEMLRHMVGDEVAPPTPTRSTAPRLVFGPKDDDEESPYKEESPYRDEPATPPSPDRARPPAATPAASGPRGSRKTSSSRASSSRGRSSADLDGPPASSHDDASSAHRTSGPPGRASSPESPRHSAPAKTERSPRTRRAKGSDRE